jgi:hypothetical protein
LALRSKSDWRGLSAPQALALAWAIQRAAAIRAEAAREGSSKLVRGRPGPRPGRVAPAKPRGEAISGEEG